MLILLKWFWKIYFLYIGVVFLLLTFPFQAETVSEWLDLALMVPSLVGLFGYAFKRRILFPQIWKLYFILLLFWDFYYHFVIVLPQESNWDASALIFIVTLLPLYIALFNYGFLSGSRNPEKCS